MSITLIVTHPGGAHKDDFLACSLLASMHRVPIQRREPTEGDLADSNVCVVDVGGSHDPALNNYDHHQFPREAPPLCALSLVLQSMGLYEDALLFCEWLRPAEWLDTRGPNETAVEMGIPRAAFSALMSPIDTTLLRQFAKVSELSPAHPVYQIMCMIGADLVSYLKGLRQRLNDLKELCEHWTIPTDHGPIEAIFLKRSEGNETDPSFGIHRFVATEYSENTIAALVYPDRRGEGYGLSRYDDSPLVDFSRIEELDDVRFAHKRGFVAKVTTTDESRLKELLQLAAVEQA
jgi:hypothetical protein